MDNVNLYWDDIPVGKANALTYDDLRDMWNCSNRAARAILHELSSYDNGDNYILIRSSSGKGFYKTDDEAEIQAYKNECIHKGRSVFAPIRKINRVLNANKEQYSFINNLRVIRESRQLKQSYVCRLMNCRGIMFDKPLLSKMENGVCLPTCEQLVNLAEIYAVQPAELLQAELYY